MSFNVSRKVYSERNVFFRNLVKSSKEQKIIGLTIGNKLNCKSHIKEFCKKTSQKVETLSRVSNVSKWFWEKKIVFDSVMGSQFSYCPLASTKSRT